MQSCRSSALSRPSSPGANGSIPAGVCRYRRGTLALSPLDTTSAGFAATWDTGALIRRDFSAVRGFPPGLALV